jgi:ribosomal protein S17E
VQLVRQVAAANGVALRAQYSRRKIKVSQVLKRIAQQRIFSLSKNVPNSVTAYTTRLSTKTMHTALKVYFCVSYDSQNEE